MRRRILALASLLSMVLCASTLFLWAHRDPSDGDGILPATSHAFALAPYEGQILLLRPRDVGPFHLTDVLCTIPDFVIASTAAAAALTLYRFSRNPVPPGHCKVCSYNLTANTSGICPECGSPSTNTNPYQR